MFEKKQISVPVNEITFLNATQFIYGMWRFNVNGGRPQLHSIFNDGLLKVMNNLGFFKTYLDKKKKNSILILEQLNIVEKVEPENIQDAVCKYIDEFYPELVFNYYDQQIKVPHQYLKEKLYQESNKFFNLKFLTLLPVLDKSILRDSEKESYLYFQNGVVHVTADNMTLIKYSDFKDFCIWKTDILSRNFIRRENILDSEFAKFVANVSEKDKLTFYTFVSAIGYLLHSFVESEGTKYIIATDKYRKAGNIAQGGNGKGLLFNAIKQLRPNVTKIDGKTFTPKNRFNLQTITQGCKIVFIDDLTKDFNLEFFNSAITEGWNIEQKGRDAFFIELEDSPKIYMTTNFTPNLGGSTLVRRRILLEFSNFYSNLIDLGNERPIVITHGGTFFEEWSDLEWDLFFNFMITCLQYYFENGLVFNISSNSVYNQIMGITNKAFADWIANFDFKSNIKLNKKEMYENYKQYSKEKIFQRNFTLWLRQSLTLKGIDYNEKESNGESFIVINEKVVK